MPNENEKEEPKKEEKVVTTNGNEPVTCSPGYHWDAEKKECVADPG